MVRTQKPLKDTFTLSEPRTPKTGSSASHITTLEQIQKRILWLSMQIVHYANTDSGRNAQEKVGGGLLRHQLRRGVRAHRLVRRRGRRARMP